MISMEKVNIRGDGVNEMKDKKPCSEFNRSNSNKPAISAPPINTSDESKIVALEKSVSFLRTQHALMLEGLHKEIENLRQVNRALQFRVVMCCCKLDDAEPDEIKRQCTIREEELVSEINSLKELLEAERKRNQALVKQIESMQLGRSVVRESKKASEITTSHSPSKGPTSDNRTASQPGSEKLHSLRPAHPKENKDLSSDYSNTERMRTPAELNLGTHARISSPELRPENSTSAIVLTPRTSVVSPEGFWVRKSIGNLNGVNQPDGLPTVPTNGQGQRAYSVRLPVLRANQQYQQAVVNDIPKGVVQSKLVSLQPNVNAAPQF
ncbi:unnamed protein product [Calicophoron daubneyi]|uniref:CCDC92/74 N-terminal domain-containing protein n=1 Tax=Calicophoron daubneyi TaxID=300641 RepID=A0AAV2TRC3_CALDB